MSARKGYRFIAFALLLSLGTFLYASPTGSISGTLKDPSGAVVPGARLTLVGKATGTRLTATSDANGSYQFPQLTPAEYTLTAEANRFKKAGVGSVIGRAHVWNP